MENKSIISTLSVKRLKPELFSTVRLFLENIFHHEQSIPKELIPLDNQNQKWWYVEYNNDIIATVAAWQINTNWHWGRLAVHQNYRGYSLGKKIVQTSLSDIFQMDIESVKINARDITVEMILKLGGKITGEKSSFYGHPITPMEINKSDYVKIQNQ